MRWRFGWFVLVVVLGATRVFDPLSGFGISGVGASVAVPLVALGYAGLRADLFRPNRAALPVEALIAVNAIRVLGGFFLALYAAGRLPAPFAPVAGWGDVAVGLTALPVAWMARTRARGWCEAALAWNVLGFLDLVTAVALGVTSAPGSPFRVFFDDPGSAAMTGLPWFLIPGFGVPILLLTHLALFARLLARRRGVAGPAGVSFA